jgi:DNA primase catalytic core
VRYPQSFIDDLRRQADIVRVVSDYVQLKKKGANWMACCPFHQEKTPSFSVNPSKGIFYCFGCTKGGSVFNFVMELEGLSFPEAVKVVAEKSGVPLPALEDDKRFRGAAQGGRRGRRAEQVGARILGGTLTGRERGGAGGARVRRESRHH